MGSGSSDRTQSGNALIHFTDPDALMWLITSLSFPGKGPHVGHQEGEGDRMCSELTVWVKEGQLGIPQGSLVPETQGPHREVAIMVTPTTQGC